MSEKSKLFAVYLEQIKDDYYDSAITLGGKRVGGGVGRLSTILSGAANRIMNLHVDDSFVDPFKEQ